MKESRWTGWKLESQSVVHVYLLRRNEGIPVDGMETRSGTPSLIAAICLVEMKESRWTGWKRFTSAHTINLGSKYTG